MIVNTAVRFLSQYYGILVMLVDHDKPVPATTDTVFQTGDKLTVFGNYAVICAVFEAQENVDLE